MRKRTVIKGLAGAAAIAGTTQAYGTVINVALPANVNGHAPAATDGGTRVNFDFNGDGTRDLSILYRNLSENNGAGYFLLAYVYAGSGTAGTGSFAGQSLAANSAYAYNLPSGYSIGATSHFYQAAGYFGHIVSNYNGADYGFGTTGAREYIGFNFKAGAQTDYGYLQLEVDPYASAANPGGIKFLSAAYDNSGAAILAGARGTNAIPEPTSLAALALGAAAVAGVAVKRRKAAAAKA